MANCLTFGSTNYGTQSQTSYSILAGGENAQFPLTNIKHKFTTKVFRSTGTTVDILVDTKNSTNKNMFGIVGNTTKGSGFGFNSVSIYGSPTTDFTGATEIIIDLNSTENFGYKQFTDASHRYWKLEFVSSGDYVEVSNIFLGEEYGFSTNTFAIAGFELHNQDNSQITTNDYGQEFITTYNTIKTLKGNIEYIDSTEFGLLKYVYDTHGTHEPIWLIYDPDSAIVTNGNFIFSGYYNFMDTPKFSAVGAQLWNSSLEFKEVK